MKTGRNYLVHLQLLRENHPISTIVPKAKSERKLLAANWDVQGQEERCCILFSCWGSYVPVPTLWTSHAVSQRTPRRFGSASGCQVLHRLLQCVVTEVSLQNTGTSLELYGAVVLLHLGTRRRLRFRVQRPYCNIHLRYHCLKVGYS